MVIECWAIIIVLIAVVFIFVRSGKSNYALGILPLVLVPLFHIIGYPAARLVEKLWGVARGQTHTAIDIFALIVACIIVALVSGSIPSKKARSVFIVTCGGFMLILSWILILNLG